MQPANLLSVCCFCPCRVPSALLCCCCIYVGPAAAMSCLKARPADRTPTEGVTRDLAVGAGRVGRAEGGERGDSADNS
jgi:hypothetical protein